MWNRAEFKRAGKAVFKSNYWLFVAVTLLLTLAFADGTFKNINTHPFPSALRELGVDPSYSNRIVTSISSSGGVPGILILAFILLVSLPFQVGACRFFAESRIDPNTGFSAIKAGFVRNYWNIVMTRFLEQLYIFLLALLLIIPGLVRALGYFAVPYILAENPELSHSRALKLSREMTMGFKGELFVMYLSFFGWYLLELITFGIVGVFYSTPYRNASFTEAYAFLRERALNEGIATIDELPGFGSPYNRQYL